MGHAHLQELRVHNYGCLKDVTIGLTRLHAFVGPNDSGKSTILRAVQIVEDLLEQAGEPKRVGSVYEKGLEAVRQPSLFGDFDSIQASLQYTSGGQWNFTVTVGSQPFVTRGSGDPSGTGLFADTGNPMAPGALQAVRSVSRGARLVRFDPDALRMESQLIPEAEPLRFYDDRGHRLAGIYDAILNRGDEAFRQIVEKVTALFPTVKAIRLRNVNQNTKALEVELRDGTRVPAKFVSEGLLYYLAFASLQYLEPASILLVEEPENGLHPVRIAEVMSVFREIAKTTQVLIATHSPLVINELTADEVSVVTRTPQEGTKVRTLAAAPNIDERTKVYSLGELWLSYANGVDESALFSGQTKP